MVPQLRNKDICQTVRCVFIQV